MIRSYHCAVDYDAIKRLKKKRKKKKLTFNEGKVESHCDQLTYN